MASSIIGLENEKSLDTETSATWVKHPFDSELCNMQWYTIIHHETIIIRSII